MYTTNITTVLEEVYENIKMWVDYETEDGKILSDINSFIKPQITDEIIETPYIWLEKGDITPYKEVPLSQKNQIWLPVRFICAYEPDHDDFESAEEYSLNIACRIIAVVQKHYKKKGRISNILKVELEQIQPNGNVQIINKQDIVPAVRVGIKFLVQVDWMKCIIQDEITNIGD